MGKKHLIIGCGTAALSAIRKIREVNSSDEVSLVTMETHAPYSPAALPYLISRRIRRTDLFVTDERYFDRMRCSLRRGTQVIQIVPDRKEVIYQDQSCDRYDSLLIASGSEPIRLEINGLDKVGFIGFHTMDDCERLLKLLVNKNEIAVYGGGLVALEIAAALIEGGYRVHIIVRSYIARQYLGKRASGIVEGIFRTHGCKIHSGTEVGAVGKKKGKIEIALTSGETIAADLFVVSTGVRSRTFFLENSGIKINRGIEVDRRMRTNISGVYAAGDVAEAPDFFNNQPGINPIAPNALQQGRIAGANMVGEELQDSGWISMNLFKFFGHSAFSIGPPPDGSSQVFCDEHESDQCHKELIFSDKRLIGARFLDIDIDPGVIRYLIENKVDVERYKELLFEKPKGISRWLMLESERR